MNDKELRVERCKLDVKTAESKLREAKRNLEEGYKKSQAQVEQAKSDMEKEYGRLKEEVKRAEIQVQLENKYVEAAEEALIKGYES